MTTLYNPLPKPATAGASELAVYLSGITYDAQSNLLSLSVGLATGVENIQSFGLRLHYDESQLSYTADTAYSLDQEAEDTPDVGFDTILSTGLTRGTGHVQRSDTSDYDDDTSTTSFVKSNWTTVYDTTQAVMVPFPNALETALYEMNFTVIGGITEVNVGFSADDLKVGSDYALTAAAAAPVTIDLDREASNETTEISITLGSSAPTGVELSFVSSTAEDAVVTALNGQLDYSTVTTFTHVTLEEGSYTADIAISDVISSLKHIVGLETLTGAGLIAADVDNDGDVAIADVISQLKHIVGLETLNTFDAVDTGSNQITEITAQTSDIQLVLNGDVDLSTDLNQEYTYTI